MVSNRRMNSGGCVVSYGLTFKGRQLMASGLPCCVVNLAAVVYYMRRGLESNIIFLRMLG